MVHVNIWQKETDFLQLMLNAHKDTERADEGGSKGHGAEGSNTTDIPKRGNNLFYVFFIFIY